MRNLFNFFKKDKVWDFAGGIHPPEMKSQSNGTPLRQIPLPERFIIPLKQHIGHEGELCVGPGDKVLRGQPLTFGRGRMLPVHAPTSGVVEAIAPHMTAHPSALAEMCIFIAPDGEDRWAERYPLADYRQLERAELVNRLHQAGVAGLGGAGFPTGTKLKGGLNGVNTLIINAAECEPYITADDRLMQDCAAEVVEGSRILAWILQADRVLIGIEDNKPAAIEAMKLALNGSNDLQLRVISTKYPSGGAKQLTRILTGKEVPHGGRSSDIGILMQNVGTAFAVKRAIIDGEALTERVVTLTGGSVANPCNIWGRLGTPVSHLLHYAGFTPATGQMVIMGGPLMGFTLPALDVPMVKITNCILAPSASEMGHKEQEQSCIRCSACADACPANLLPQQLYWFSQGGDHDKARSHHIDDCIECGACAWVCPSNIPLVHYYRLEKAELRTIDLEAQRTAQAKARFEARQQRLEREKLARETRHKQAKRKVSASDQTEVTAALERVKAKKAAGSEVIAVKAGAEPDNAAVIAQREARKAQARARQAEKQAETEPMTRQSGDPRKAAVEAAIARAKAKKASRQVDAQPAEEPATAESGDPRKAAVEAAIARAKAKKASRQVAAQLAGEPVAAESGDPRKAAVEAAIARAKAKKASRQVAAQPAEEPATVESGDPRKAAVEAAIARAKAKKASRQVAVQPAEEPATAESGDPRKAAVEAAIARAKAKKSSRQVAAQPAEEPATVESGDPRKAAVAAAIARAKAKKASRQVDAQRLTTEENENRESNTEQLTDDPRKAAVAAAIARVKARKAQQHSTQEE